MTDEELLTEQIEAVRADIDAHRSRDDMANQTTLATMRESLAKLIKARRESIDAVETNLHRRWVREREKEIIGARPAGEN